MKSRFITIAFLAAGVLSASAYGADQPPAYGSDQAPNYNAAAAQPGALNYVEGSAMLDGSPLSRNDVGRATVEPGQTISTNTGKAEVLLTPGVFLRLDDHSAVKMISPDLTRTQVEIEQGRAAVEVDQIFPQNDLQIVDGGVTTQLLKNGFYEFDAGRPEALVFQGKAAVSEGDGKFKDIKDHHEVALVSNAELKSSSFNTKDAQDQFYNWSLLRSQYLAEANNQIAGTYAGDYGFAAGWYWDPYMWDYTFIGMGPYWSPFGFGFYPPWGWYGGYWGGGFYGGRFYHGRGVHGVNRVAGFRGRGAVHSFRGGGAFAGGGFHGEGGFHGGGGFSGGFHGGGGFHGR